MSPNSKFSWTSGKGLESLVCRTEDEATRRPSQAELERAAGLEPEELLSADIESPRLATIGEGGRNVLVVGISVAVQLLSKVHLVDARVTHKRGDPTQRGFAWAAITAEVHETERRNRETHGRKTLSVTRRSVTRARQWLGVGNRTSAGRPTGWSVNPTATLVQLASRPQALVNSEQRKGQSTPNALRESSSGRFAAVPVVGTEGTRIAPAFRLDCSSHSGPANWCAARRIDFEGASVSLRS